MSAKGDNGNIQLIPSKLSKRSGQRLRAKLTASQVLEIFHEKYALRNPAKVCSKYGVSEKTIRDIWSGRTWRHCTKQWNHIFLSSDSKSCGRPQGSKDLKPRKMRGKAAPKNPNSFVDRFQTSLEQRDLDANPQMQILSEYQDKKSSALHDSPDKEMDRKFSLELDVKRSDSIGSTTDSIGSTIDLILWDWERGLVVGSAFFDPFKQDFILPALLISKNL